ncbi:armadillo-type protein [Mycena epipterygia]|nr:armadillo-type protein [Mycena epipterygia]
MIEKLACHEPSAGSQLVCLLSRIAQSEAGAWDVVSCLDGLLRSLDPRIRQNACRILGVLTVHNTIAVAIFRHVDCCNRLVCLLDDTNMGVVESAAEVLRTIAQSEVDAPIVVSCLHELLQSRDPQIRQNACRMLRVLAVHNTGIFRSIVFCNWLVSLLDDSDLRVIKSVANAIQTIAQSALASMDTEILNYWAEANTTVDARRRTGYRPRKESPQKPTVVSESIDGILVTTVSEIVVGEVKAVRARRFSFDSDLDSDVDSEVQNRTRIAGDLRIA